MNEWRCFHCDEVFADRKLAEDHFGQVTLHPAACVDPLRADEKAMRERAMSYERSWRAALAERDALLAENRALAARVETLFPAIAHGDDEHRAWLKEAIDAHFADKPAPPPRGSGQALSPQREALRTSSQARGGE